MLHLFPSHTHIFPNYILTSSKFSNSIVFHSFSFNLELLTGKKERKKAVILQQRIHGRPKVAPPPPTWKFVRTLGNGDIRVQSIRRESLSVKKF